MKNILLILLFSTTFMACVEVKFENSQPAKTKNLSEFPTELQGKYLIEFKDSINELDTFIIAKNYFSELTLGQKASSKPKKDVFLSDSLVVKQIDNNFTINIFENDFWMVVLLKPNATGYDVLWINGENEDTAEQLNLTTKVKTIKNEDGEVEALIMNPKKKEFAKMIDNQYIFTPIYKLIKVKQ